MRIGIDATRAYDSLPLSVAHVARCTIEACKTLSVDGVEWVVVCLPEQYDAVRGGWGHAHIQTVKRFPIRHVLGLWTIPFAMKRNSVDVVVCLDSVPSPLYFLWGVRVVHCIHDLCYRVVPEVYTRNKRVLLRVFDAVSVCFGARIICPSDDVAHHVCRLLSPQHAPSVVRWAYDRSGEHMTRQVSTASGVRTLIWVGRIEKKKNPQLFLDLIESLHAKGYTHYRAVMIGNPGYGFDDVSSRIHILHTRGLLVWHRSVPSETLNTFYASASLLVTTSVCEGYGMTVDEALSWGVPVIGPLWVPSIRYRQSHRWVYPVSQGTLEEYCDAVLTASSAIGTRTKSSEEKGGRCWGDVARDIIHICTK